MNIIVDVADIRWYYIFGILKYRRSKMKSGASKKGQLGFGEIIVRQRISLGFSQSDVASRTGLSTTLVSQYETGIMQPGSLKIESFLKLSRALDLPPSFLLSIVEGRLVLFGNGEAHYDGIPVDMGADGKRTTKRGRKPSSENMDE